MGCFFRVSLVFIGGFVRSFFFVLVAGSDILFVSVRGYFRSWWLFFGF